MRRSAQLQVSPVTFPLTRRSVANDGYCRMPRTKRSRQQVPKLKAAIAVNIAILNSGNQDITILDERRREVLDFIIPRNQALSRRQTKFLEITNAQPHYLQLLQQGRLTEAFIHWRDNTHEKLRGWQRSVIAGRKQWRKFFGGRNLIIDYPDELSEALPDDIAFPPKGWEYLNPSQFIPEGEDFSLRWLACLPVQDSDSVPVVLSAINVPIQTAEAGPDHPVEKAHLPGAVGPVVPVGDITTQAATVPPAQPLTHLDRLKLYTFQEHYNEIVGDFCGPMLLLMLQNLPPTTSILPVCHRTPCSPLQGTTAAARPRTQSDRLILYTSSECYGEIAGAFSPEMHRHLLKPISSAATTVPKRRNLFSPPSGSTAPPKN